ncbi:Hsp20/alpha crystallin family protein [Acetobacterium wieringae]|uniref:Hsp20/alpha crystallin family protein n=1 Tax=Acetobacterium wieringae TaxID=52694 RepID=UPI0026F147D7|nr:Hsp20/alpha crystallin family protein [Acetobacterium wieringae]
MFGITPFKKNEVAQTGDVVDFYNLVDNFFNDRQFPMMSLKNDTFKVDVKENDTEFMVDAEVPGYEKGDIHICYDNENLMIQVEKKEEKEEKGEKYIHRERSFSSMQRGIYLPNVLEDQIKASFENGVLKITAPKGQAPESKKEIPIE